MTNLRRSSFVGNRCGAGIFSLDIVALLTYTIRCFETYAVQVSLGKEVYMKRTYLRLRPRRPAM